MVSNAIKFTDRKGQITIAIEHLNDRLKFSVQDSGIGIKKKNHKKIFKMYNSIKNAKKKINTKGIGLGLVISKMIVNHFQGEIDFDSKYKRGSTFWFTFETQKYEKDQINSMSQFSSSLM